MSGDSKCHVLAKTVWTDSNEENYFILDVWLEGRKGCLPFLPLI